MADQNTIFGAIQERKIVLVNLDGQTYLGDYKDPETSETLASIVGTKESWVKTEQTSQSLFFDDTTGMGTRKFVQEYIYHPNEIKSLPTGVAIYAAKKPTRHGVVLVRMRCTEAHQAKEQLVDKI